MLEHYEDRDHIDDALPGGCSRGFEEWTAAVYTAELNYCDMRKESILQEGAAICGAMLQLRGFDILGEGMNHTLTQLYVRKAVAVVNIT